MPFMFREAPVTKFQRSRACKRRAATSLVFRRPVVAGGETRVRLTATEREVSLLTSPIIAAQSAQPVTRLSALRLSQTRTERALPAMTCLHSKLTRRQG